MMMGYFSTYIKWLGTWLSLAFWVAFFAACSTPESGDVADAAAGVEVSVSDDSDAGVDAMEPKRAELGPVKAVVYFSHKAPVLGDRVTLTLEVDSQPDVEVTMPAFGELLGRFEITSFRPKREVLEDGSVRQSQRYILELPMSGKQRIPAMLIDFVDKRPEALAKNPQGLRQELLTPAFTIDVASPNLGKALSEELRPARGTMAPKPVRAQKAQSYGYWIAGALAFLVVIIALFIVLWLRRRRVVISPYDRAKGDLAKLSLPSDSADADEIDAWTVRLSGIMRRYIEDQFELKAPRLTTEEFIEIASSSSLFSERQRKSLRQILEGADRVKFTTYLPQRDESQALFDAVEGFIDECHASVEAHLATGGV